jgi:hypothetical protein
VHGLSAPELLAVWEGGLTETPNRRALALLSTASGENVDALAELTIGRRDRELLLLRSRTFGGRFSGVATCPACGERVEATFDAREVVTPTDDVRPSPSEAPDAPVERWVERDGYSIRFRTPTTADLEAVADLDDPKKARDRLLRRCILQVRFEGVSTRRRRFPGPVTDALVESMSQADPQADVRLSLSCPSCPNQWEEDFDITAFFWSEVDAWAPRLLEEVHVLAAVHGWSETEILAMTPLRRQIYMELVGA